MDATMRPQPSHDNVYAQQQQHMGMYSMPAHYAHQPPTLYSNGPSVMTPTGSPRPMVQKPAIVLDTDFDNSYYPSTPPLSTSGSTVGSPKSFDALQTPMNPMFSGLDESEMIKLEAVETCVLDWSNAGSPPMTPSKCYCYFLFSFFFFVFLELSGQLFASPSASEDAGG